MGSAERPGETRRGWRVLFLSLEFADPIFSGNGVYARSIVRNLRSHVRPRAAEENANADNPESGSPANVMVICGCPAGQVVKDRTDNNGLLSHLAEGSGTPRRRTSIDVDTLRQRRSSASSNASSSVPLVSGPGTAPQGNLEVLQVTLSHWYKLDRTSAWEDFGRGVSQFAAKVQAFKPDVILGVDWTSTLALQTLRSLDVVREVPSIYLNFRVFSSSTGISEEDAAFYREREALAIRTSHLSVALCEHDAALLRGLVTTNEQGRRCIVHVLNPPLRADMRTLALRQARVSRDAARQLILYRRSISDTRGFDDDENDSQDDKDYAGARSRSMDGAPSDEAPRTRKHASATLLHRQNSMSSSASSASASPRGSYSSFVSASSDKPMTSHGKRRSLGSNNGNGTTSTIPRIGSFSSREDFGCATSAHVQHGFGGPRPLVLTYLKSRKANRGRYGFRRNLVTCCCRICPEKNVQLFVEVMVRLKDFLKQHHLVPCLVGPPTDEAFANKLYLQLDRAFPGTTSKVIPKFVSSRELGEIFGRTVLNVHPALYEAYGMTIVEAGAFGAPTLMHGDGEIGAQDLLSAPRRAILADMTNLKQAASIVKSLLCPERSDILASIGTEACHASIGWDDEAFATGLSALLESAVLNRFNVFHMSSRPSFESLEDLGRHASPLGSPLPSPPSRALPSLSSRGLASTSAEMVNGNGNSDEQNGLEPDEAEMCANMLEWAVASALSTGRVVDAHVPDVRRVIQQMGDRDDADLASAIELEYTRLLEQETETLRLTAASQPSFSQAKATLRTKLDAAKSPHAGSWAGFLINLPVVAKVRYQLVPSRLPEEAFWAILFTIVKDGLLHN
ncbi:Hypothetical Protein FCC1311_006442 [Hondaea fermentalgiana]|uniref:BSD domain-containing protein n=1 Tax=Hondaea fermentalgiana TaxID=2315210 RepID=A0A2R5G070_9STRA|nr:Hypothetical Protein FCC1311_006442 [Hondaea fermentalgiana]|eukprot:GBG24426.1 Hypothetical Protein FCC1311_006442 [Hondaea fermentalgiana]